MTKLNRSIERGLTVLEIVHGSGACSLAYLAARSGLAKPTLLRICATLEARRWLVRRKGDGRYQIGSAFPQPGRAQALADRLVAAGKEEIVRLSEATGLGVDLAAAVAPGQVEIVDTTRQFKRHGVYPHSIGFRPSPIQSALGAAFLAALSGEARTEALNALARRLGREDAATLPRLPDILKATAARGYAVRAPGHWGRAVDFGDLPAAIAVALVSEGRPVGAINLVWKARERSVPTVAAAHLARLRTTADAIAAHYAAGAVGE